MFRRAAFYDSQATHVPFQAIKEGGNRNQVGANPEEFKKIIAGDGSDEGAAEGPVMGEETHQNAARASMQKSSATEEGQVLNIGIVEVKAEQTAESSATNLLQNSTN